MKGPVHSEECQIYIGYAEELSRMCAVTPLRIWLLLNFVLVFSGELYSGSMNYQTPASRCLSEREYSNFPAGSFARFH